MNSLNLLLQLLSYFHSEYIYNSKIFRYHGCTTVSTNGKKWCAIGIQPGQEVLSYQGTWGWCTESNIAQPGQHGQFGQPGYHGRPGLHGQPGIHGQHGLHGQPGHHGIQETAFRRCKIPFQYQGRTHYHCTSVGHTGPWCYFDGPQNPKAWGNCQKLKWFPIKNNKENC